MTGPKRAGEFETIARCFKPLAAAEAGAFALGDDAAVLGVEPGRRLVVTTDTLIQGVHFPPHADAETIAIRTLAANLSDLAAMGAKPAHYVLSLALPAEIDDQWLDRFAAALGTEQNAYGVTLAGGDTVSTPGPLSLTMTALGSVAEGGALRRSTALPGDTIYVSGTIGDATLGLLALDGGLEEIHGRHRQALVERFNHPRPRTDLGQELVGVAHACIDISDGLAADLGHIATQSDVWAVVEWEKVPLSAAVRAALGAKPGLRGRVLTGGEDYELLFTALEEDAETFALMSQRLDLRLTAIGRILGTPAEGQHLRVQVIDGEEAEIPLVPGGGYRHF